MQNPGTFYNGMMSGHRNMFLSSSVAIAMIVFLGNNKSYVVNNKMMKVAAILILLIASYIGISASLDFEYFLNNNPVQPNLYNLASWRRYKYIGFIYSTFLVVLAYVLLMQLLSS